MKTNIKNFLFKRRIKILKNNKGFSLMELLIVVSIMGVISAIAIPAYDKYRTNANKNGAEAEAKTIWRAINTCLANGTAATTCVGGDGNVDGTISKKCKIAEDSGKYAHGKQIDANSTDEQGHCFMKHNGTDKYCIASNIGGEAYCMDNSGVSSAGKGCSIGQTTPGTCLP